MNNNFFTICSFFYSLMLTIIYFRRKNIGTLETKIYSSLILTNFANVVFALLCTLTILIQDKIPFLTDFVGKTLLLLFFTWEVIFTLYLITIASKNVKKTISKLKESTSLLSVAAIMLGLVIYLLPLYTFNENRIIYTYGPSANFVYALTAILIFSWIVIILKNYQIVRSKKCIPVILFIFLALIAVAIQKANPGLLLITAVETFITVLMFFTIENPDLKMIEELSNFNKLSERNNMDKESFLFNITQQIKAPLNAIQKCVDNIEETDDFIDVKQNVKDIKIATENLHFIINSGLNISSLDASKIKVVESKYNINNLLNVVSRKAKNEVEAKGLTFTTSVEAGIPELLYGDSIKVKQIINALISNSLKCTKEGFIELRVSALTKKDACRLYISVEDSGCGMRADEINKLYNKESEEEKIQKSFDDEDLDLLSLRKVVNFIGGTVMIESEVGNGTKVTVVLNQRVYNQEKSDVLQVIDTYDEIKSKEINILLIDDNKDEIKSEKKILDQSNTNLTVAKNGEEGLKFVRKENIYDIIFVSEKMEKLDGSMVMAKLKKIEDFDTPVILMSKVFDEKNKSLYLKSGFSDVVEKPIESSKVAKVLKIFVKK